MLVTSCGANPSIIVRALVESVDPSKLIQDGPKIIVEHMTRLTISYAVDEQMDVSLSPYC
jgi:hypothetical protein